MVCVIILIYRLSTQRSNRPITASVWWAIEWGRVSWTAADVSQGNTTMHLFRWLTSYRVNTIMFTRTLFVPNVDTQLETRIVSLTVTSPADVKCDKTEVIYYGVKFDLNAVYQSYRERFAFLDFPWNMKHCKTHFTIFCGSTIFKISAGFANCS